VVVPSLLPVGAPAVGGVVGVAAAVECGCGCGAAGKGARDGSRAALGFRQPAT